jgi:hypothetical protein
MTSWHLTDEELDRLLVGDGLQPERAAHVEQCVPCRRRWRGFLAVVETARGDDPSEETREGIRRAALESWAGSRPRPQRWWLAAAAAALLVVLGPLAYRSIAPRSVVNAEAILEEVDAVLARDPLTAVAPEELVEVVTPAVEVSGERSVS